MFGRGIGLEGADGTVSKTVSLQSVTLTKKLLDLCEACRPPKVAHYEGTSMILTPVKCTCNCPVTDYQEDGTKRCRKCDHLIKGILVEGLDEVEYDYPHFLIDGEVRRLDEVQR